MGNFSQTKIIKFILVSIILVYIFMNVNFSVFSVIAEETSCTQTECKNLCLQTGRGGETLFRDDNICVYYRHVVFNFLPEISNMEIGSHKYINTLNHSDLNQIGVIKNVNEDINIQFVFKNNTISDKLVISNRKIQEITIVWNFLLHRNR